MGVTNSSQIKRPCSAPVVIPSSKLHSSNSASSNTYSDDLNSLYHNNISNSKSSLGSTTTLSSIANENEEMSNKVNETYEFLEIIGHGASAEVYRVRNKITNELLACKILKKNNKMNDDRTMNAEVGILKRLSNNNIIRLFELYETSTTRWIIMELAEGGNIQDRLVTDFAEEYSEYLIAKYFMQVLLGVSHLHKLGIVHRDLKSDNIICSKNSDYSDKIDKYSVKITDFGLSAIVPAYSCGCSNEEVPEWEIAARKRFRGLKQQWGTTEHFAPEIYSRSYGAQVDIWALGCVLYQLLTGDLAFPVKDKPNSLVERIILNGGKRIKRSYELKTGWSQLSSEAQSLLHGMLRRDPKKRLSVEQCLAHPWFTLAVAGSKYTAILTEARNKNIKRRELRKKRFENHINQLSN